LFYGKYYFFGYSQNNALAEIRAKNHSMVSARVLQLMTQINKFCLSNHSSFTLNFFQKPLIIKYGTKMLQAKLIDHY